MAVSRGRPIPRELRHYRLCNLATLSSDPIARALFKTIHQVHELLQLDMESLAVDCCSRDRSHSLVPDE